MLKVKVHLHKSKYLNLQFQRHYLREQLLNLSMVLTPYHDSLFLGNFKNQNFVFK